MLNLDMVLDHFLQQQSTHEKTHWQIAHYIIIYCTQIPGGSTALNLFEPPHVPTKTEDREVSLSHRVDTDFLKSVGFHTQGVSFSSSCKL